MSRYKANKQDAVTFNREPTMTDQSQAENTDINVIVNQFLKTGQVQQGATPIYADFSELPDDLRGFIEVGRSIGRLEGELPEQLRGIPVHELVTMTNEQLLAKLAPPDKTADKQKDDDA